jgi:hypothetical protein
MRSLLTKPDLYTEYSIIEFVCNARVICSERICIRVTQCRVLEDNTKYLKVTAYLWSIPINSFAIFVTNFQGELPLHQHRSVTPTLAVVHTSTNCGRAVRHLRNTRGSYQRKVKTCQLPKHALTWRGVLSVPQSKRGTPYAYAYKYHSRAYIV